MPTHTLHVHLKVRQSWNDFFKPTFPPKNEQRNSTLLLWNLRLTCFRSFFGGNWRQQKDISKLSDLWIYSLLIRIKLENEKKRSSSKAVLNTICSMHVVESKLNWKFRVIAFILSMWKSVYRVFHIIQAI